jgi:hypothetical protein
MHGSPGCARPVGMKPLKLICSLACLLLFATQVWSMSHWNEARGVYDDICYLRQAHLFQRFGLAGFDTDISHDDDGYLTAKLKEISFPANEAPPCHTPMPASKKLVIQYPPGTGFLLSLFPERHQVIPLFVAATTIMLGFALLAIFYARSTASTLFATGLGCLSLYIMINPVKASYSMAPTMVVCALAGWLTAKLFAAAPREGRLWPTIVLGLLFGLSVNLRLANVFLSAGYFVFFLVAFLSSRKPVLFLRGFSFGVAFLIGLAPTLIANAVNAGSPFATTYTGQDVEPPMLSLAIVWQYFTDMQFVLLMLAAVSVGYCLRAGVDSGVRRVALVAATNLAVNMAFFFTHSAVTPYYTIPVAMLSMWGVAFAALRAVPEAVEEGLVGQAAVARS